MWAGSDIITQNPDIWLPYDIQYPLEMRVDDVVKYISRFNVDLTFLYFHEPVS